MNADMGEMQYGSGQRLPPVVCDFSKEALRPA